MTHDVFEDELRTLMRDATESARLPDVDPATVLGTGRRVLRRRRTALAGGTLAFVAVLGAGSWTVLNGSADRAAPEVPATRTSSVAGPVRADLPGPDGDGGAEYSVTLDRATGQVSALVRDGDSGVDRTIGSVPRSGAGAVWGTVSEDPFVVLGVLPADADQVMTRYSGPDLGGTRSNEAPLPGTGYKAVIFTSEKSPGGAALSGLDYSVGMRVFASDGTEVPSATVGSHTVYVDADAGEIGILEPDGSATRPLPAAGSSDLPAIGTARGATKQPLVSTFAVVVPIGAQDVSVQVAEGATLRSTDTAPLLGGAGLVVLAVGDGPETLSPFVTGVTWTIDGEQRSWTNRD